MSTLYNPHEFFEAPEQVNQTVFGAVTLGLSLQDCSSRLPQTVRARVYDKIRRAAGPLSRVVDDMECHFGVSLGCRRIVVTPLARIADGFARDEWIGLAQLLDTAAEHVQAAVLEGFAASVAGGLSPGQAMLLKALPAALVSTKRLAASVHVSAAGTGLNADALFQLAKAISETARLTADASSPACLRLAACGNTGPASSAFRGAIHAPIDPDLVLRVAVSLPALLSAVSPAPDDLGSFFEVVRREAFRQARAAAFIARECAVQLNRQTAYPVAAIRVDLTMDHPTEPFSLDSLPSALLTLAAEAAAQGVAMGTPHTGRCATTYASSQPDIIPVPGDTPPEVLTAFLLDVFVPALYAVQPRVVRLVPVAGKRSGESVKLGHDSLRVQQVPHVASSVRPGGHVPPPHPNRL